MSKNSRSISVVSTILNASKELVIVPTSSKKVTLATYFSSKRIAGGSSSTMMHFNFSIAIKGVKELKVVLQKYLHYARSQVQKQSYRRHLTFFPDLTLRYPLSSTSQRLMFYFLNKRKSLDRLFVS